MPYYSRSRRIFYLRSSHRSSLDLQYPCPLLFFQAADSFEELPAYPRVVPIQQGYTPENVTQAFGEAPFSYAMRFAQAVQDTQGQNPPSAEGYLIYVFVAGFADFDRHRLLNRVYATPQSWESLEAMIQAAFALDPDACYIA